MSAITINGKNYPAPLRNPPPDDSIYYEISLHGVTEWRWVGHSSDIDALKNGRIFSTKEDAQMVLDALNKALKGEA